MCVLLLFSENLSPSLYTVTFIACTRMFFAISDSDSWKNILISTQETSLSFHEFLSNLKLIYIVKKI